MSLKFTPDHEWIDAADGATFEVTNPARLEPPSTMSM